ncbi:hypothetical protein [Tautonia sociabilis]|uniref:Alpha/beta hydrolase n=1 Tax=Tautonia sociabilis TaxID=2080755 RepID=A0A432MH08_9BACT|nr:hypothetical protein [Tautonia sociabilis]RUL85920.1 hypothetical protein TsocGM_17260 [Tautonia sociabilis]
MGPVPALVIKALLLVGGLHPAPKIDPEEFRSWFREASEGRMPLEKGVLEQARGYRYVFVLGLLNERMPGYFSQITAELRAMGVPREAIFEIAPSSDATFEENLGAIRDEFLAASRLGPEPIVVIGHSRGACDALAFAMMEPQFVSRHVAALFLIQGPFGGSGAADYVLGTGTPMDDRMPPRARLLGRLFRSIEARKLDRGKHQGLADLARDAARDFWKTLLREHAASIPIVGPRTFYIEAIAPPERQPPLRRPVARYLETYYGPNDGLVAAEDQFLPGLGTRLGMFDASHTDLTHRFPAALARPRVREAMAKAIVTAISRPGDGEEPSGNPVSPPDREADESARAARR